MDSQEYDALIASKMPEKILQKRVGELARAHGWRAFHVTWSPGTTPGWPDLALFHPERQRTLFRELKTPRGVVTRDQKSWLDTLTRCGHDAGIWRTSDLFDGTIERELKA